MPHSSRAANSIETKGSSRREDDPIPGFPQTSSPDPALPRHPCNDTAAAARPTTHCWGVSWSPRSPLRVPAPSSSSPIAAPTHTASYQPTNGIIDEAAVGPQQQQRPLSSRKYLEYIIELTLASAALFGASALYLLSSLITCLIRASFRHPSGGGGTAGARAEGLISRYLQNLTLQSTSPPTLLSRAAAAGCLTAHRLLLLASHQVSRV